MNKRFIWNFEINPASPLNISGPGTIVHDKNRWESRYFWPDDQIITLQGLDERFLELSRYRVKHRTDTYYLLPDCHYNLKTRREQLFYKPALIRKGQTVCYGKKINLEEHDPHTPLPGCEEKDTQALLARVKEHGISVKVEKEAVIYTFNDVPSTKLELAWLHVGNKAYYSVCIESLSHELVDSMFRQIAGDLPASDYVTFLKESLK